MDISRLKKDTNLRKPPKAENPQEEALDGLQESPTMGLKKSKNYEDQHRHLSRLPRKSIQQDVG